METWMWISLYIIQTLVGAVLWRKYMYDAKESVTEILLLNALVVTNIIFVFIILFKSIDSSYKQLCYFIDFLAGVKNKETEEK